MVLGTRPTLKYLALILALRLTGFIEAQEIVGVYYEQSKTLLGLPLILLPLALRSMQLDGGLAYTLLR